MYALLLILFTITGLFGLSVKIIGGGGGGGNRLIKHFQII